MMRSIKAGMAVRPDLTLAFRTATAAPATTTLACPGFAAQYTPLFGRSGFDYTLTGRHHYLALHDLVLADGEARLEGLPASTARDLRSAIAFAPRGSTVQGWSVPAQRSNAFTAIFLDPDQLNEDLGERLAGRELRPLLYTRDARLQSTLGKLQTVLAGGEPDALYAESLCMTAALELLQCGEQLPSGALSRKQASAVLEQIGGSLHEKLEIGALAQTAGLSRYHFARAFKNTVGHSPYRFVILQRVERAMELLARSDASIEGIAAAVGFSSASQFGRAFRKETGQTPVEYRRAKG